jgi:folate-dependent phosphoribosylglycinamide formyltransferase PurN
MPRSRADHAHAGVTVHLVDEGVDTSAVLYQPKVDFASDDNIATYRHRQMAAALPPMIRESAKLG